MINPVCPHISEELWSNLGNKDFISLSKWPKADEEKINEKLEKQEETIEKIIDDINNISKIIGKKVSKAYVYLIPNDKEIYTENLNLIEKRTNLKVKIHSVNDKDKYDPENKSKKAKPEKPAIYLE